MAASVASDYGIDFRVIEQNAVVGSTRYWYGAINTEETKKAGVEVNTAALRSEISRYSSGKMDQRVLNVWINKSAAMHDYVAPILPMCVTASSYYASNKGQGIKAGIWAGAMKDGTYTAAAQGYVGSVPVPLR